MALLQRDEAAESGVIDDAFGIDWNGPMVIQVQEQVNVPNTPCPLQDEDLEQLKTLVDPMLTCDDYGVVLYIAAREFVQNVGHICGIAGENRPTGAKFPMEIIDL